jgi:RNA polymerase sigma-70 factor (ECF subfamily)
MNRKEEDYIIRILKNDESALEEIYDSFSGAFISFFRKYGLSITDLEDAFQDSIIALYQNIMQGNLKIFDGSIQTYIWAIGKYKVIDAVRKKKKNIKIANDYVEPYETKKAQLNERQQLLYKHFKSLGKSCQKVLKYFYYEGLTLQEIVEISDYKDENSVKSSKSRCIKQLRDLIKKA